jgi:hypothetical protein
VLAVVGFVLYASFGLRQAEEVALQNAISFLWINQINLKWFFGSNI